MGIEAIFPACSKAALALGQVGTGERSERIRTYNFPQGRVTDHRAGVSVHNIEEVVQGDGLGALLHAIQQAQRDTQIAALEGEP